MADVLGSDAFREKALAAFRSPLAGGFADQAVVSFGNFGLNIALARTLSLHEYGVFSVVLSFMLFLNTLHSALVGYPLAVRGAPADTPQYERLLRVAAIITLLCGLVSIAVLSGALMTVHRIALLPLAGGALLFWQFQEVCRRGALARAHSLAAISSDAVRYLGVLLAVVALRNALTIERVLLLLIVASLLAVAPTIPELKRAKLPTIADIRREIAVQWKMAHPVLGASLLMAFSSQWFLWLMAWNRGPEEAAALVALANVVAISSPVMFGAENVLVPEIARLRGSMTFAHLTKLLRARALTCSGLVAPFFLLIALFPEAAIRLFYGQATPFAQDTLPLRLLVLAYACYVASFILGAALRGYRSSEAIFMMQLGPALLGITLGSWLTWQFGLTGACMATLLTGLLRAGLGLHFVLQLRTVTARDPLPEMVVLS